MALKYLAEQPPVVPFRAAEPPPPLPADVEAPLPPDDAPAAEWHAIDTAPRDGSHVCVTDDPVARPLGCVATWRTRRRNVVVGVQRQWVRENVWASPRTFAEVPFAPKWWKPVVAGMWW